MMRRLSVVYGVLLGMVALLGGCQPEARKPTIARSKEQSQTSLPWAREQLQQGNIEAAKEVAIARLTEDGQDAEAIFLVAQCQAAEGKWLDAVQTVSAIPDTHPVAGIAALGQASDWLLQSGDPVGAERKLKKILEVHGEIASVHRRLADLYIQQGRRFDAAPHLKALIRLNEFDEKDLFALSSLSEPFVDTQSKASRDGALTVFQCANVKELWSDRKWEQAEKLAQEICSAFPESTATYAFLGRIYAELQQTSALDDWKKSLPRDIEREPDYWYALATWAQQKQEHREAIRCYCEAVVRDETFVQAYLGLHRSLLAIGDPQSTRQIEERYQALREVNELFAAIGKAPGTLVQLERLAKLLDNLNRPWEALGWRWVALQELPEAKGMMTNWEATKNRLLKEHTQELEQSAATWRLCGLDRSQWPLPDLGGLAEKGATLENGGTPSSTKFDFVDRAQDVGLHFQYENGGDIDSKRFFLHEMTGGGIGVVDFDLDGWPDTYFSQGGGAAFNAEGSKPNRMFRNLNGATFLDVTESTQTGDRGYGQGVAVADLNQDGFPDLVVANIGPNRGYLNQGDGTFRLLDIQGSSVPDRWTTSVACGDLDGDHLPEIVEINYCDDPAAMTTPCLPNLDLCSPNRFRPASNRIWRNAGDGTFALWEEGPNFEEHPSYGFAAIIADFEGSGANELFLANDADENQFWVLSKNSNGKPIWQEEAIARGCATGLFGDRHGCMGVAHGDFDHNGLIDLHITNFWNQPADLYLQQKHGLFQNGALRFRPYESTLKRVGFGTQSIDIDHDGWLDLVVLNGHIVDHSHRQIPFRMPPQVYRGSANGFDLESASDSIDYWKRPALGRTLALCDWNRDGRMDLIANHLDQPAALLENRTAAGNWIQLEVIGRTSERDAIGAKVQIEQGEQKQVAWVVGGDGFLCTNESMVELGLGRNTDAVSLEVRWPSGTVQRVESVEVNHRYLIIEGDDKLVLR